MMKLKSWILGVGLLISNVAFSQTVQDGFRFLDRHQPSRAKQVFDGLVASAPTGDNYFNLGLYYLNLRDWDNAKATFGPPDFDDAVVTVVKEGLNIKVKLHY